MPLFCVSALCNCCIPCSALAFHPFTVQGFVLFLFVSPSTNFLGMPPATGEGVAGGGRGVGVVGGWGSFVVGGCVYPVCVVGGAAHPLLCLLGWLGVW